VPSFDKLPPAVLELLPHTNYTCSTEEVESEESKPKPVVGKLTDFTFTKTFFLHNNVKLTSEREIPTDSNGLRKEFV
jgi:hypothetical protein